MEPHTILDATGHVAADLACTTCRYNLRTQPVDGKCSECGHAVTETTAGYLPILDHEGHVADDLPCVNCGYNLRTMAATSVCPECAAQVALSARGHYLHVAPPRWVKRLANGALLLVIAMICSVALPIIWAIFSFVGALAAGAGKGISDGMLWMLTGLAIALGVVCLWLFVRGLLQLTAPEPGAKFRGERLSARKLVRYSMLAIVVFTLIGMVVTGLRPWVFGPAFRGLAVITLPTAVAYLLLPLALLRHIMLLMCRIPRPGLVTFARIEFWGALVGAIVYIASSALMVIAIVRMPVAVPGGVGMPMTPYATGPNTPGVAATASAPALTSLGYTSTTVTYTGPGGVTTTMPASVPVVMPPTFGPAFVAASVLSMTGGCGMLIVGIAGFVLLILVWRALANAARLAKQNAPPNIASHHCGLHWTP